MDVVGRSTCRAIALLQRRAGGSRPAQPRQLAVLASGAIGGPACAAEPALEQIGPATVAVSLHAACAPGRTRKKSALDRGGHAVARARARQELWLGEPAVGERLAGARRSDVDGDQRDDLVVRVSVEGAPPPFEPGPRVSADLRWLDRPQVFRAIPNEPEASLRRAALAELARAAKKADRRRSPRACGKSCGSTPGFAPTWAIPWSSSSGGGDPLRTEPRARRRRIGAAFVPRSPWATCPARSRVRALGWRPVTTTKQRRAELEKALLKAAPARVPSVTQGLRHGPRSRCGRRAGVGSADVHPGRRSPGSHQDGLATVNVQTGAEGAAQGIPSWPGAVTNLDGSVQWTSLCDSCDGIALRARLGNQRLPVPIHLLFPADASPARRRCGSTACRSLGARLGSKRGWPATHSGASDLTQVKSLSEVGALGQPVHAGSPRSPDSRSIVVGTKLGALVRAGKIVAALAPRRSRGRVRLRNLRGCTISNDARSSGVRSRRASHRDESHRDSLRSFPGRRRER